MGSGGKCFTVTVTRKELVAAVVPMQEHWLQLSNLDLLLPPIDVSVFFCYKKPHQNANGGDDFTFGSMVGVLRKALAQALVSCYAFAGEVVSNSVGEPELLCNNRGVDFMEAYADAKLHDLSLYNPDDSIEGKLVPKKQHGVLCVQGSKYQPSLVRLGQVCITEGWSFGVDGGDSSSGLNLSPTTSIRQPPHTHSQIAPPPMLGLAWLQICDYKWCRLLWVLTTMVVCEGGRLGAKISKVTELKCGGLMVGCTFDHRIANAYSANMFLVSWAEMALCKPLSVAPSFWRSLLNIRRPGSYDPSLDEMYVLISALPPPRAPQPGGADPFINRIYYVTAEQLSLLQTLASTRKGSSYKRTKLESFSAFLWKMVSASAVMENDNKKTCKMGIVVDGRRRLSSGDEDKSAVMASYFGNVLSIPFGEKMIDELKEKL
ncbi:Putrescine hydroxycinnamoyltransferase 1 [Vitis vinifera]|uniref:Putrescine hydroxycinnamoyltransferase 1 n=1 Tax=Vitis vinifera TaxID=29760 RepID=A0A438GS25_VITVI|nr:Putrescine hydroxycinnamoyltransferase 1 [Vitis vinifera]